MTLSAPTGRPRRLPARQADRPGSTGAPGAPPAPAGARASGRAPAGVPPARAGAAAADGAWEVLRRRVAARGVPEPVLARSGANRIIVELPGVQAPAQAREVIGRTAQLPIRPVLAAAESPAPAGPAGPAG